MVITTRVGSGAEEVLQGMDTLRLSPIRNVAPDGDLSFSTDAWLYRIA